MREQQRITKCKFAIRRLEIDINFRIVRGEGGGASALIHIASTCDLQSELCLCILLVHSACAFCLLCILLVHSACCAFCLCILLVVHSASLCILLVVHSASLCILRFTHTRLPLSPPPRLLPLLVIPYFRPLSGAASAGPGSNTAKRTTLPAACCRCLLLSCLHLLSPPQPQRSRQHSE